MPAKKKYETHYERREAQRRAKREWAARNREHVRENFRKWYERKRQEKAVRDSQPHFTKEELIERIKEIKRDWKRMSQRKAAAKWGVHRRTLERLIKKYG